MPDLVLGPVLRYVSEREATVWVETDAPCEVEILGHRARTFQVQGHSYALVVIDGLEPDELYEYEVRLDDERRFPLPDYDFPPPAIRTIGAGETIEIAFGSCRAALPHDPPYTLSKDEDERGFEFDALFVLAREMIRDKRENWPDVLMLLGDQVYVDEGSPVTRSKIAWKRDITQPPHDEAGDYEEYTWLYHESWSDPLIRWLFANVSCSMVWDDHDMRDDWNISRTWVEEMRKHDWWRRRVVDGFMSYWVYQHLGNLSPRELEDNEVWQRIQKTDEASGVLRDFAEGADSTGAGTRWSYCRDLGNTRMIVMDARAGRVLHEDRRSIFDEDEWDWICEHAKDEFEHLVLGTSVPFLMLPAFHGLQVADERIADGIWGRLPAKLAEKLRQGVDIDHWPAFAESFDRLAKLIEEIASGKHGKAPATITVLSGDVHHAYLAEADLDSGATSRVYQAVCSPFRNPLDANERRVIKLADSAFGRAVGRGLMRITRAQRPRFGWELLEGPYFDNQLGILRLDGPDAELTLDKTVAGEHREKSLHRSFKRSLT
jgi:phosphodiesterase/alkaline phosphatase D-like protein